MILAIPVALRTVKFKFPDDTTSPEEIVQAIACLHRLSSESMSSIKAACKSYLVEDFTNVYASVEDIDIVGEQTTDTP